MYKQTIEKIDHFTELFVYAMIITGMIVLLLPLFYAIVGYCVVDLGRDLVCTHNQIIDEFGKRKNN